MIINNGEITKSETILPKDSPEPETNEVAPVVMPNIFMKSAEDSDEMPAAPGRHCYNEDGEEISCQIFDDANVDEVQ